MDVFQSYTYGTAGWFTLQAVPLLVSPSIIISFLSTELREPTVLEIYLSRSLALALFSLATITLLLTDSIPLSSISSISHSSPDDMGPYAMPTVEASMLYHTFTAIYTYTWYSSYDGTAAHLLGCMGSVGLALMGLWIVLFGGGSGRVSKRTGADKRTSNFPFGNKESASARKKGWGKAVA